MKKKSQAICLLDQNYLQEEEGAEILAAFCYGMFDKTLVLTESSSIELLWKLKTNIYHKLPGIKVEGLSKDYVKDFDIRLFITKDLQMAKKLSNLDFNSIIYKVGYSASAEYTTHSAISQINKLLKGELKWNS